MKFGMQANPTAVNGMMTPTALVPHRTTEAMHETAVTAANQAIITPNKDRSFKMKLGMRTTLAAITAADQISNGVAGTVMIAASAKTYPCQ